ncbi:hypothetical protein SK128_014840 [Halocaridina rubra]|uniref:Uncharacterized protein n=1 Tax=Halocaridina rubra TaxID=373956 RepID=A0AAN8X1C7_HALRR
MSNQALRVVFTIGQGTRNQCGVMLESSLTCNLENSQVQTDGRGIFPRITNTDAHVRYHVYIFAHHSHAFLTFAKIPIRRLSALLGATSSSHGHPDAYPYLRKTMGKEGITTKRSGEGNGIGREKEEEGRKRGWLGMQVNREMGYMDWTR